MWKSLNRSCKNRNLFGESTARPFGKINTFNWFRAIFHSNFRYGKMIVRAIVMKSNETTRIGSTLKMPLWTESIWLSRASRVYGTGCYNATVCFPGRDYRRKIRDITNVNNKNVKITYTYKIYCDDITSAVMRCDALDFEHRALYFVLIFFLFFF